MKGVQEDLRRVMVQHALRFLTWTVFFQVNWTSTIDAFFHWEWPLPNDEPSL
jgi:hypothetical protein